MLECLQLLQRVACKNCMQQLYMKPWHNSKTTMLNCKRRLCMLPMAKAQLVCSSDGVATCFVDDATFSYKGAMGQNQAGRSISKKFARWWYQVDVRQLQCGTGSEVCYIGLLVSNSASTGINFEFYRTQSSNHSDISVQSAIAIKFKIICKQNRVVHIC